MSAISPPPARRTWNVALIISICLNLVLAGIIAAAVYRFAGIRPMFPGASMPPPVERMQIHQIMSPRALMHAVPDKVDAIRAVARSHRARLEPLRAEALAARRDVLRLYSAPNLDKAGLDQALARMQAADAALEIEMLKVTAETGAVLSPEDRKNVLQSQPHDHGFHVDFGGWHHGGGPGGDRPPQAER